MLVCGSAPGLATRGSAVQCRIGREKMAGVLLRRAAGAARTVPSAWRSNVSLSSHRRMFSRLNAV